MGFDFGTALGLIIKRRKVYREIWQDQWLEPEGPTPYAVLCKLDGTREPWCMSIEDMRATDWMELTDNPQQER